MCAVTPGITASSLPCCATLIRVRRGLEARPYKRSSTPSAGARQQTFGRIRLELKRFGSDLTFSLGVLFLELSGLNYGCQP